MGCTAGTAVKIRGKPFRILHEATESCSNTKQECMQQKQQLRACTTILLTWTDVCTNENSPLCILRVAMEITLLVTVETSCLAAASCSRHSHVIADSYLLLDTDSWKSHCRPEDLCLQILALPLQVGGSPKQVLHDIRGRGAGELLPLIKGDAGCMLQQMHLLMQHTPHIPMSSVCHLYAKTRGDVPSRGRTLAWAGVYIPAGSHWGLPSTLGQSRLIYHACVGLNHWACGPL